MRGVLGRGQGGFFGLARDQRGGDADHDQRRHDQIACGPGRLLGEAEAGFKPAHQKQRASSRGQHAQPISRDIGGHAGGLLAFRQAFDAKCVDDDILRGGGRGDEDGGGEHHVPGRHRGVAESEQRDRNDQQKLREEQPAASPPEQR